MSNTGAKGFWLTNLPIQWKFACVIAFLLALLLMALGVNTYAVREAADAQRASEHVATLVNRANITARAISRRQIALIRMVFNPSDANLKVFEDTNEEIAADLAALRDEVENDVSLRGHAERATALDEQWARASAAPLLQLMERVRQGQASGEERDGGLDAFFNSEAQEGGNRRIVAELDRLIEQAETDLDALRDELAKREARLELINALTLLATMLAGIFAFFMASKFIAHPLRDLAALMERLASRDHSIVIPYQGRGDEVGIISRALVVFKDMAVATHDSDWVKSGVAEISAKVQQAADLRAFAEALLEDMAPRLKAGVGVFFAHNEAEGTLSLLGSWGYRERRHLSTTYRIGEGLVGQCGAEQRAIVLAPVPDDYVRIHSGTGEASPRAVLVVPVLAQGRLLGVLELASFEPFDALRQRLVDEVLPVVGLSLDNLARALRTRDLLEQSQRQAQELQAAEEELRVQQEELRTTNEQLQKQSQRLMASEEELRVQADELQASNEELRRHSEAVGEQKARLEALQRETEAKAAALERANQYKSQFLANMSHELRTPLNSMLILSQDLAENHTGNLDEEQVESATIIHSSGSNLLRLINEILDLSKVEAGKMDVVMEPVPLAAFCQRMERNFRHVAQEKGLDFTVEIAPDAPQAIVTDEGKLEQITNNLLGNAFKFTHDGFVKVAISASDAGKTVEIQVSDSGIGIPADKLDTIFEAFEQVDASTRRQFGGTGLGLAISRSLATLLGGTLTVASTEGEGTAFRLVLPVGEVGVLPIAAAPHAPAATAAPAARSATPPVARPIRPIEDDRDALEDGVPRILVVEDDPVFARTLVNIVRRKGYQVLAAGNGEAGLELARTLSPTGILLDIMLPGMDGWGVIEALKADPDTRHIPVHIVSALEEAPRGRQLGAVGFLTKPVSSEQLSDALAALTRFNPDRARRVLVVDDDEAARLAVQKLISRDGIEVVSAASGEEAMARIADTELDCIVLDLGLPGMSGFDVLEHLTREKRQVPVVIYSGRDLTGEESLRLRGYTDSIVIKGALSPERLLDEVSLFLHSVRKEPRALPAKPDGDLEGRHVLLVDDDMRNIYALAKVLRGKGMSVILAQDGAKALAQLDAHPETELVLMDIMMPVMDGYEAMTAIRRRGGALAKLPIIALTAKAMKDDRDKCLAAGASDYMSKPIDVPHLLSMIRSWLPPQ